MFKFKFMQGFAKKIVGRLAKKFVRNFLFAKN